MARQATALEVLRGKILNAPPRKEVLKEVEIYGDKVEILFIEPSYGDRQEMATYKDEKASSVQTTLQSAQSDILDRIMKYGVVLSIIYSAHEPTSKLRMFGVEDVHALSALPSKTIDALAAAVNEVNSEDEKKS